MAYVPLTGRFTGTEVTGRIGSLSRRPNTPSGNPRWSVQLGRHGVCYMTARDSQVASIFGQDMVGCMATLKLNDAGEIIGLADPMMTLSDVL